MNIEPNSAPEPETIEIYLPLTYGEQRILAKLTPAQLDEVRTAAVDAAVAAAIRIRAQKVSEADRSVDLRDQPPAD